MGAWRLRHMMVGCQVEQSGFRGAIRRKLLLGVCGVMAVAGCGATQTNLLRTPGNTGAGVSAVAGQTVYFTLQPRNDSATAMTLSSLRLWAVPGIPAPHLVAYAVMPARYAIENATGWPPPAGSGPGPGGSWPVAKLSGYVVAPHSSVSIVIGVYGERVGTVYAVAGVIVGYTSAGVRGESHVGMPAVVCADTRAQARQDSCESKHDWTVADMARQEMIKVVGGS